jgi:hypothetical protein
MHWPVVLALGATAAMLILTVGFFVAVALNPSGTEECGLHAHSRPLPLGETITGTVTVERGARVMRADVNGGIYEVSAEPLASDGGPLPTLPLSPGKHRAVATVEGMSRVRVTVDEMDFVVSPIGCM